MTNDEILMTKEFLKPNDEGKSAQWLELLGHSCFELLSTFVIRISSLFRAMIQMRNAERGVRNQATDNGALTTDTEP